MNTLQIANILSSNIFSKKCFKGITPSDRIVRYDKYPYALVVNTDKHDKKGEHWVAIYIPNENNVEYFDSFGQEPNDDILKFLSNFKNLTVNKNKLQSIFDISCGPFVIYFIVQRCRGKSFQSIIKQLDNPYSDILLKMFLLKMIAI